MFMIVFLVCIIALYIKWVRVRGYWANRHVPFIPPHPILGNLTFLQKINPGIWMRKIADRYPLPYVGAWWFWRPVLIVNSPEIARRILIKDSHNFRNRLVGSGHKDTFGALNLLTVNDPIWSELRRPITKAFSSAKLKQIQSLMTKKSKDLMQRIRNEIDTEINLRMLFTDYSTDVITTFIFGIESDATLTKDAPFRSFTKDIMKYSFFRGLAWCSIFFWPELADKLGLKFYPKSSENYFKKIYQKVTQCYDGKDKGGQSVLDILMRMKEENKEYTEDLMASQAAILLFGGFDTTGTALTFLTYELAYHPDVQEKLFDELQEAKRSLKTTNFDFKQLSELTYLDCAIKETFRKYTSMGWLDRVALNDYEIDENLTIQAGTPVYLNAIGMHYNPKYFPDPCSFVPERFLPENEKNIEPYTYIPFGDGPRICIGQRFAFTNMRTLVAALILNYSVSPLPNRPTPTDMKIENKGLFYSPGQELNVKFKPRSSQ